MEQPETYDPETGEILEVETPPQPRLPRIVDGESVLMGDEDVLSFFGEMGSTGMLADLAVHVERVATRVIELGKSGTVTLTLRCERPEEPYGNGQWALVWSHDVNSSPPRPKRRGRSLFRHPDGSLKRDLPPGTTLFG